MAEIWLARQMGLKGFEEGRRHQADQRHLLHGSVVRRDVPRRGAHRGAARPPEHRADSRSRSAPGRLLHCDGVPARRRPGDARARRGHRERSCCRTRTPRRSSRTPPRASRARTTRREWTASRCTSCTATSSPQNIFITYEGVVKMVDFGVAKAANRASSTSGGQLKGKFGYMAPEQARGEEIDARADVWSLGVVLFETVTRTRLFDPKSDALKLLKEVGSDEPIVPARERNPDVPAELEAIIAKALARDAKHRYPERASVLAGCAGEVAAHRARRARHERGRAVHAQALRRAHGAQGRAHRVGALGRDQILSRARGAQARQRAVDAGRDDSRHGAEEGAPRPEVALRRRCRAARHRHRRRSRLEGRARAATHRVGGDAAGGGAARARWARRRARAVQHRDARAGASRGGRVSR